MIFWPLVYPCTRLGLFRISPELPPALFRISPDPGVGFGQAPIPQDKHRIVQAKPHYLAPPPTWDAPCFWFCMHGVLQQEPMERVLSGSCPGHCIVQ